MLFKRIEFHADYNSILLIGSKTRNWIQFLERIQFLWFPNSLLVLESNDLHCQLPHLTPFLLVFLVIHFETTLNQLCGSLESILMLESNILMYAYNALSGLFSPKLIFFWSKNIWAFFLLGLLAIALCYC